MRNPALAAIVAGVVMLAATGCVDLPALPAAPSAPVATPAPSTPTSAQPVPSASDDGGATPVITPAPTPTSTIEGADPAAPVIDCAVDASPDIVSSGSATVIGECTEVYIATGGPITVEHADTLTINGSGVSVSIGSVDALIVNGTDADVDVATAGSVNVNGIDHVVEADEITVELSVNGSGHQVTWQRGVAATAASNNGDSTLDGP